MKSIAYCWDLGHNIVNMGLVIVGVMIVPLLLHQLGIGIYKHTSTTPIIITFVPFIHRGTDFDLRNYLIIFLGITSYVH